MDTFHYSPQHTHKSEIKKLWLQRVAHPISKPKAINVDILAKLFQRTAGCEQNSNVYGRFVIDGNDKREHFERHQNSNYCQKYVTQKWKIWYVMSDRKVLGEI